MKTKSPFLLIIFFLSAVLVYAQQQPKKSRQDLKLERERQISELVIGKKFVFIANMALPQGGRSVNLSTTTNSIKFDPDLINSEMPFYGTAYSGSYGGRSEGMRFKGKPEDFTVTKKKNGYDIKVIVKADNDSYRLNLSVYPDGSSDLYIISNNRSTISYSGEIFKPEGIK